MLKNKYQSLLDTGQLQADPAQAAVVEKLQRLYDELAPKKQSLWQKMTSGFNGQKQVKGLYLWGGVGRGKTFLVDLFFQLLPSKRKKRMHFHRFMHQIHQELHKFENEKDPLKKIAKNAAEQFDLLCFDEFVVNDIGDAMILAGTLEAFLAEGVCFVATSNVAPDNLYRNGLQRAKFLPAIELIKANTAVMHMDKGEDFRLRALEKAEIYHTPLDNAADAQMQKYFAEIAPSEIKTNAEIVVLGRRLTTRALADGVLWMSFKELCDSARSSSDYIELSKCFQTLFLSGVPQLTETNSDAARRFINLIDELYDHRVKLILSAEKPVESLYTGDRLAFEFKRTQSRLQEMQSHEYLGAPHSP